MELENEIEAIGCFNKADEYINYFRIKAFSNGFMKFNRIVVEQHYNSDLVADRANLIKKFISNIMLDTTSSDSKIIGNLNTPICEASELINKLRPEDVTVSGATNESSEIS